MQTAVTLPSIASTTVGTRITIKNNGTKPLVIAAQPSETFFRRIVAPDGRSGFRAYLKPAPWWRFWNRKATPTWQSMTEAELRALAG